MEEIFNIIIQDKKFLDNVKSSVNNIMMNGKVDISDIPEIILLITTTINTFDNLNINENMLPELIKKIFDFIIPDKNPDFDKIINSAIKLVMIQPIIQKEVKKCCSFFSCFRKKNTKIKELDIIHIEDNKVEDNKVEDNKVEDNKVEKVEKVEKVKKIKKEKKTKEVKVYNIETTSDDDSVIINNDLDDFDFTIKENNIVDNLKNTITLLNNNVKNDE